MLAHSKILVRSIYILIFISLLLGIPSCSSTRKEAIERNGLHSDDKPSDIAKEFGKSSKKRKKVYNRAMKKRWRKINPGRKRKENPFR